MSGGAASSCALACASCAASRKRRATRGTTSPWKAAPAQKRRIAGKIYVLGAGGAGGGEGGGGGGGDGGSGGHGGDGGGGNGWEGLGCATDFGNLAEFPPILRRRLREMRQSCAAAPGRPGHEFRRVASVSEASVRPVRSNPGVIPWSRALKLTRAARHGSLPIAGHRHRAAAPSSSRAMAVRQFSVAQIDAYLRSCDQPTHAAAAIASA